MTPDRDAITRELLALGVRPGDTLLVHSSFRSLGPVTGGPSAVIDALLAALGPQGTLLLPALSYEHVDEQRPRFDVRATPSNVGIIPETFRLRPGVRRSVHPTHSVCAVGPRAAELLDGHEKDRTPCGLNSPFRRSALGGGRILFLGCGPGPNTTMHAVEEAAGSPYLFGREYSLTVTGWDGRTEVVTHRRHGFAGWRQRYDRVVDLLAPGELVTGPVLRAACHLMEGSLVWERALAALAADPWCLVEPL